MAIAPPQRLVSLVPSLTELLFALGLDEEVVGLTKFCIHPADKVGGKTIVGGTKTIHLDRVAALHPTLILANREENTREDVEWLQARFPVLLTDVITLDDALTIIRTVGQRVHRSTEADELAIRIQKSLASLSPVDKPLQAAYLIWRKPWMVAGSRTFIDAMLRVAGFSNAFGQQFRYPVVTPADLQRAAPEVILLSSEPYPFKAKHLTELVELCPQAKVVLVDGELFSWYGSRLLRSADYFQWLRQTISGTVTP